MGMLLPNRHIHMRVTHTQMDSRDSFGRGTTGTTGTELLLLLSYPAFSAHAPEHRIQRRADRPVVDMQICDLQNYDCVYENFMLSKLPSSLTTDSVTNNRTATVAVGTLDSSGNQARKKQRFHGSEFTHDLIKQSFALLSEATIFV